MPDISKEDLYGGLTPEEARRISEEMVGNEFAIGLAPYLGYAGDIDPTVARYRGMRNPHKLTMGGYYAKPMDDPNDPAEQALYKKESRFYTDRETGEKYEFPMEPDTVNAINARATPNIWAHEYRHRQNPNYSEKFNRLADAVMAQNEGDWASAVNMWRDKLERDGENVTDEQAENELLDRLLFNAAATPRGVYKDQYDKGARATPANSLGDVLLDAIMKPEGRYQREMEKRSLWRRKADARDR